MRSVWTSKCACVGVLGLAAACTVKDGGRRAEPNGAPSADLARPNPTAPSAGPAEAPPAETASAAAQSSPSGQLKIGPLELANAQGEALALTADGTVTVVAEHRRVGRLLPDGTFVDTDGKVDMRLTADGDVYSSTGRRLPVRVDREGVIYPPQGPPMSFDRDGRLVGGNPNAPETRVIGITPETRRAAAFLLLLAAFPNH